MRRERNKVTNWWPTPPRSRKGTRVCIHFVTMGCVPTPCQPCVIGFSQKTRLAGQPWTRGERLSLAQVFLLERSLTNQQGSTGAARSAKRKAHNSSPHSLQEKPRDLFARHCGSIFLTCCVNAADDWPRAQVSPYCQGRARDHTTMSTVRVKPGAEEFHEALNRVRNRDTRGRPRHMGTTQG